MTALRFVLIVVMTLAATQIAAADTKKSKSSTGSIEVNSYSWGVTNKRLIASGEDRRQALEPPRPVRFINDPPTPLTNHLLTPQGHQQSYVGSIP